MSGEKGKDEMARFLDEVASCRAAARARCAADPEAAAAEHATRLAQLREMISELSSDLGQPAVWPEPPAEGTPLYALEECARIYRQQARQTSDPMDLSIARILSAAWLAETRRNLRTSGQDDANRLAVLSKEAERYLATLAPSERVSASELPPSPGERRTDAVRVLIAAASALKPLGPSEHTARDAYFAAQGMVCEVFGLGLHRTTLSVNDEAFDEEVSRLARKLYEAPRARSDQIASWALQACGVPCKTADNWIGSAIRDKKSSAS